MKMRKPFFGSAVLAAITALVMAAACGSPTGGTPDPDPGPAPVISVSTQPANATVTAGGISGSLSVKATVTEGAALSFRWYRNDTASNEGGTVIDGATEAEFAIPADLTEGAYYYFCEITAPGALVVRSRAVTVTVNKAPVPPAPRIDITSQPAPNTEAVAGYITESLSVTASGINGAADIRYQWYSNTTASNEGGEKIDGATAKDFAIPVTLTEGTYYYFCEVTASNVETPARSGVATVTVIAAVPAINIVPLPANTTVTVGEIIESLSVKASGSYGAQITGYQWYSNTTQSNEGGTAIESATTKDFTIPTTLTAGEYFYYCVVTASGVAEPKSTNAAKVTVSNFAGAVVITPNEDPELVGQTDVAAAGVPKTFSAEGSWVTYQWYVDSVEQAGETGADFEFNEAAGVYEITVVVTDADGASWSGSCRVTVK